jgi:hypothetical protein
MINLITQINLGFGAFEELNSKIVQSTAFVYQNAFIEGFISIYDPAHHG